MTSEIPYAGLDPNTILGAIESVGLFCDGRLQAMNSYENRVYQVGIVNQAPLIAKFYRPHRWSDETILEEHQFAVELMEHELPVVAPWISADQKTLHYFKDFRFALFPCWGGRALELDQLDRLEWMGRFIGRLHAVGACHPFHHRPHLMAPSKENNPYEYLFEHQFIPHFLQDSYRLVIENALQKIKQRFDVLTKKQFIRIHGDLHAGNILWNAEKPHIIDLDDCLMGPAIQDIWMLLFGDNMQRCLQLEYILRGYRAFHDFNEQELSLIEALRMLRQLEYCSWLAKRWHDPAFQLNFPWFNTSEYWQQQLRDWQELVDLL